MHGQRCPRETPHNFRTHQDSTGASYHGARVRRAQQVANREANFFVELLGADSRELSKFVDFPRTLFFFSFFTVGEVEAFSQSIAEGGGGGGESLIERS